MKVHWVRFIHQEPLLRSNNLNDQLIKHDILDILQGTAKYEFILKTFFSPIFEKKCHKSRFSRLTLLLTILLTL